MTKKLFSLISLGCPKNLVDSERFAGIFAECGFTYTQRVKKADVVLINTCGFIAEAVEEAINVILETLDSIKNNTKLIVTGCLVKRYKEDLLREIPEVDFWVDLKDFEGLKRIIDYEWKTELSATNRISHSPARTLLTPSHYAYLRISDGCDNRCAYCAIPSIRGEHKSESIETLLKEAQYLASIGVKELIINAQDTTNFGVDIYGKQMLIHLLREIQSLHLYKMIRLLYLHPAHLTEKMIDSLAEIKTLLPYFDIPLQHINDDILNKMNRKIDKKTTIKRLNHLRKVFPDCAIRTTFMTGFPSETRDQFRELLDFVREFKFTRLGVFTYSAETGTPAFDLTPKVTKQTAQRRKDKLMAIQQEISKEILAGFVGKTLQVIVDKRCSEFGVRNAECGVRDEKCIYQCRSYLDAPEIDGKVYVSSSQYPVASSQIAVGDIISVKITEAWEYDLLGYYKL